ncbi:hypothetical protein pb186bvf_007153 [Paramecium bursaria]
MISTTIKNYDPSIFILDSTNFGFYLGVQNSKFQTYIDSSVFKVNAYLLTRSGGSSQKIKIPLIIKSYSLFYVDWDEIKLISCYGDSSISSSYSNIEINIDACHINNRENGDPPCKTEEEIETQLRDNKILISFYSSILYPKNPEIPFQQFVHTAQTAISATTSRQITYFYQPTEVITDFGLILSDIQSYKSISFNRETESVDLAKNINKARITFKMTTTESQNFRSYSKLQDILGSIGGLWNVLFFVAKYLQQSLSDLSYKLQIINSFFNFEGQDESIKGKEQTKTKRSVTLKVLNAPPEQLFTIREKQQIKPIRKNKQKQSTIKKKLENIKDQNDMVILQVEANSKNLQTSKNESIKNFFHTLSKKLRLGFLEFMTQLKFGKQLQFEYSILKMNKQLDILYIVKKIQEIDTLKMLLFDENQIKVFEYLPKPLITEDPQDNIIQTYYSILSPSKSNYQKATQAQLAFKFISNNLIDPINQKLIKCMDAETLEFLEIQINNEKVDEDQNEEMRHVRSI